MTIAEQIIQAVAALASLDANVVFSREEIRQQAGVSRQIWDSSYSPIFQGMRSDQPGGGPKVGDRFRDIFRQVERGKHTLTDQGKVLIAGLGTSKLVKSVASKNGSVKSNSSRLQIAPAASTHATVDPVAAIVEIAAGSEIKGRKFKDRLLLELVRHNDAMEENNRLLTSILTKLKK